MQIQKIQQEFNKAFKQRQIELQHQNWLQSDKQLYNLFPLQYQLEWPSEFIQWLPYRDEPQDSLFSFQKIIVGTNTKDKQNQNQDKNFLLIAKVQIPLLYKQQTNDNEQAQQLQKIQSNFTEADVIDQIKQQEEKIENKENFAQIEYEQKIFHEDEVINAQYMPQKYNFIATKSTKGDVLIFDTIQHPSIPKALNQCIPQLRLTGHNSAAKGLAWNPNKEGVIASGGGDNKICVWDIEKASKLNFKMEPTYQNTFHKGKVNDVCWHKTNENILGAVSSDKQFSIWDLKNKLQKPTNFSQGHQGEIFSIDFSPFNQFLFLTASSDKTIALWDMRNTAKRVIQLQGHNDIVNKVQWIQQKEGIVLSCSKDRQLNIWDLNKNKEQELIFAHKGHASDVISLDQNRNDLDKLVIASIEKINILQIWKMSEDLQNC